MPATIRSAAFVPSALTARRAGRPAPHAPWVCLATVRTLLRWSVPLVPLGSIVACSAPAESVGRTQVSALSSSASRILGIAGMCLDDSDDATGNGTRIQIWGCNGTDAQAWTYTASGELRGPGGKCVDVTGGNATPGTLVQLYDCNGTAAQRWTWSGDGSIVGLGGLCLDDQSANTSAGNPVQVWTCNGTAAQQWSQDAGDSGSAPPSGGGSTDAGSDAPTDDASSPVPTLTACSGAVLTGAQASQYLDPANGTVQASLGTFAIQGARRSCYPSFGCSAWSTDSALEGVGVDDNGNTQSVPVPGAVGILVSLAKGDVLITLGGAASSTTTFGPLAIPCSVQGCWSSTTTVTLGLGSVDMTTATVADVQEHGSVAFSANGFTWSGATWNGRPSGGTPGYDSGTLALASSTGAALPAFTGTIDTNCISLQTSTMSEAQTDASGNAYTLERVYWLQGTW